MHVFSATRRLGGRLVGIRAPLTEADGVRIIHPGDTLKWWHDVGPAPYEAVRATSAWRWEQPEDFGQHDWYRDEDGKAVWVNE